MGELKAGSLPELVRMADRLGPSTVSSVEMKERSYPLQ
jgi:hypothetical protein